MTDNPIPKEMFKAFYTAKCINHYYYMHTDGDWPGSRVRIENIQKVIELMTGKPIIKRAVPIDGTIIRGITEKYADRNEITIRSTQSIAWQKYTTVKEFSHIVIDDEQAYEPDPNVSIEQLVARNGIIISQEMSPATRSEGIAEVAALELIYPLEFREEDAKAIKSGVSILEIEEERHVPASLIQMATGEAYILACKGIWESLPKVDPPSLPES